MAPLLYRIKNYKIPEVAEFEEQVWKGRSIKILAEIDSKSINLILHLIAPEDIQKFYITLRAKNSRITVVQVKTRKWCPTQNHNKITPQQQCNNTSNTKPPLVFRAQHMQRTTKQKPANITQQEHWILKSQPINLTTR